MTFTNFGFWFGNRKKSRLKDEEVWILPVASRAQTCGPQLPESLHLWAGCANTGSGGTMITSAKVGCTALCRDPSTCHWDG